MTNLMCRGRKRGLAGVIATQRLAKLAKNVAAEASNFLMGRTFLDIDMARAADLLGMERRQAEMFRDLGRGQFVALGPALSRRPLPLKIGAVATAGRGAGPKLLPLPPAPEAARDLILAPGPEPAAPPQRRTPVPPPPDILAALARARPPAPESPAAPEMSEEERETCLEEALGEILEDPEAPFRNVAVLYQDFVVRCRMKRVGAAIPALPEFRRRLAVARAGGDPSTSGPTWDRAMALAADLPEELSGVFLLLARAAIEGTSCPDDLELAKACGSRSPGRARRLLAYLESRDVVVVRQDRAGGRIVAVPDLSCETAPGVVPREVRRMGAGLFAAS
jgi:hypothetical protein